MYVDTFNLKGEKIPIRDSETRKIVDQLDNVISGAVGNSMLPIYLEDGEFKPCGSTLNVNITGEAQSAVTAMHADSADNATHADSADNATHADSATHADNADSATRANSADSATHADNADSATHADSADSATHADSADSATEASKLDVSAGSSSKPVYFSGGKPVQCNSTLAVDISGNADSADSADNATHANSADNATHADSADSATRANSADSATHANSADSADNATHADSADSATHADSADSATHANSADSATHANNADSANIATNAISATAATIAEKLKTSAGANTRPVYFSNGKPVQCGSTLDADISGNAYSADNVTLNSVLSPPFIRIPIDTTNGRIYMLTGAATLNVNISTVYGNAFIGDFTIPIPRDARLPNGYYSVQVTCQANFHVVIPALQVATGLANIVGWVESSISRTTDVLFYVFIMGY